MLNTTNSNSEYLHNYIRKVAKQEQESVDISSVYTGTIEAAQSGIYTIVLNQSDNSSSVLAIPIVSGDVYDKDDSVYLLRANTTATVNYFIVGKVNAIQEVFFNLTELERFNPNESKADLSFGSNNFISISEDANNIFDSINELGYFQLEVKITSKVEDGAKIIIYLNYTDKSHYGAKFVFSSYEFIGQPGGNNYTLVQKKIFHLPSNINIKNIRIEKVGDFSVAAMNIVAGSLLEISAAYQNSIIVQNDRNYFEKEIPDTSNPLNTVTLTSKIYYNNKPLVGDALQYYWFLKDDSAVNPESSDYLDIEGAGNGWRCLNTLTLATTADGEEIRLWDNKNNFITLNKKNFIVPNDPNEFVNFSNFVNKVKCIVKYFDNFIESDLIDIYNYDYEQFSATLTTNVDPIVIINREDAILLECKVANNNSKIDLNNFVYKYEWHLGNTILSNLKDGLIKVQDKTSTTLEEKEKNVREMENDIEEYYCKVSIYHKNDTIDGEVIEGKQPISEEISNTIQVTSAAAATDIQEEVQYKYYIADNHSVTFEENTQTSEDIELSKWSGDWDIYDSNVDSPSWSEGSFDKVFNDLDLFNNKDKTKEYFVYYTKRTIVRQGLEILRKEAGSFPQIARSVIYVGGWKNHRVGDNVNQLNTFNQLSDNGKEDGIYYADIAKITTDDTPDWGTKYYERNVSPDGEISYTLISLEANIHFKKDQDYYIYNSEKEQYELVLSNTDYDKSTEYYEKINDNEYQKLIVNTQNFDITNVAWPSNKTGPFYTNIDNKLLINASYIRSGTLEVKDKFYASIDQEDVRIAGFSVNETTLESNNGSVGLNSDNSDLSNIAIWAGAKNGNKYPFQVTHEGELNATEANIEGTIRATELYIGTSQTSLIQANSNILAFNSDNFYIYSNNLKLNYNEGYSKGYFTIETTNFGIDETGNARIAGTIEATSGRIGDNDKKILICDGEWLLYNKNFSVSKDGIINANNAIIEGTIEATSGKIGSSTNYLEIMSSNGNILNHTNFSISSEGKLKATDADIEGTITSINGEIGGFHIGETSLSSIAHFTTSEPIKGDAYYEGNYSTILTSNRLSCRIDSNDDTSSAQVFGWDISLNGICVSTNNKNTSNYKGGAMLRAYFKDRDWTKMRHTGSLSVLNKTQNTMALSITVTIPNNDKFLNSDIIAKTSPQKNSYYYVLQNISSISTTFNIYQGSNAQGTKIAENLAQSTLTNTYGIQFSRTVPTNAALGFQIKVAEISSGYTYSTTQYAGSIEPLYNEGSLFVGGSINKESGAVGMYAISSYRGPYIEFTPTQAILHYNSKAKSTWVLKDDGTGSITEIK